MLYKMTTKKQKFYAVKYGVDPDTNEKIENQIFTTLAECERVVKGVSKAQYKSFKSKEKALAYLNGDDSIQRIDKSYDKDTLLIYVDGSYNEKIPNYSFGLVCVKDNQVIHRDFGLGKNADAIEMRQIGGELLGAMKGLLFAKKENHQEVVIVHDYQGVSHHATGEWKRSNNFSKLYYEWMQNFFKQNPSIHVSFAKVDGHTGNDFNEIADGLAKKVLV